MTGLRSPLAGILVLAAVGAGCLAPAALAKDMPLTAIELYDGPSGPAYVQLSDVLINAKAELRDCTPYQNAAVDKSTYGKMGKVLLGPGGILERNAEGVMHYTAPSGPTLCVVPANARFEHNGAYSLSGLADQALLHGTPIIAAAGTPVSAPPIRKGVKLIFVNAPNLELAEFLRAQRANDMEGWQGYLSRYPSTQHTAEAKRSLALIYIAAAEASLQAYDKSLAAMAPVYSELKSAKSKAGKAHALTPDLSSSTQLDGEIRSRLAAIVDLGRGELDLYRAALASRAPGYIHLQSARKFSDTVAGIDSFFPAGQTLTADGMQDSNAFEAAMQSADSAVSGNQFDQAYAFVLPYRAFAEEEARVAAVVDAAYGFHLERGNKLEQSEDWTGAIREFEKTASIKDTAEARDSLKNAQKQLVVTQDKTAAQKALAASADFQTQHNMIRAYEALASLPAAQQPLVVDQMKTLEPAYVLAAAQEAKALHQA
ncbi:MAG: hypothetical protein ABR991_13470, partial [Terracidiphilus sp.]